MEVSRWWSCCWKVCQAPTAAVMSCIFSPADRSSTRMPSRCATTDTSCVHDSHCRQHH